MDIKEVQRIRGILEYKKVKRNWAIGIFIVTAIPLLSLIPTFVSGEMTLTGFLAKIWLLPVAGLAFLASYLVDQNKIKNTDPEIVAYVQKAIIKTNANEAKKAAAEAKATSDDIAERIKLAGKPVLSETLTSHIILFENRYVQIKSLQGAPFLMLPKKIVDMQAPEKLIAMTGNTTSKADTIGILTVVTDKGRYGIAAFENTVLANSNNMFWLRKNSAINVNQVSAI
jgi:hypothetical protein